MDSELRIYPREKYLSDLKTELETKGLYGAIEQRTDEINENTSDLGYVQRRYIQEQLVEILDLVKMTEDLVKMTEKEFVGADCASCPIPDIACFEQCKRNESYK